MNGEVQQPAAAADMAPDSSEASGLWVFGYGSLCWHPGFDFRRSVTGFVKGYARKFWQGNTTHRGTEDQPGRVATLVEERDAVVWGRAFELTGEAALPYLANRECKLGGYATKFATFFPKRPCAGDDGGSNGGMPGQPFPALLYVATPSNRLWLGDAPLPQIAEQIVSCQGATGHNVEYLLRLADYMRAAAPEADDDHLFSLEQLVRHEVRQRRLCLQTLMGEVPRAAAAAKEQAALEQTLAAMAATVIDDDLSDDEGGADIGRRDDGLGRAGGAAAAVGDVAADRLHPHHHHHHHHHHRHHEQQGPQPAQQPEAFASRVTTKKLRCLNI